MRTLSVLLVIFLSAILPACAPIRQKVIPAEITWAKSYGGKSSDYAPSIQQTTDGGYIVAGCTKSLGADDWDSWVLKLKSNGAVSWQKRYGGTWDDYARSIQQTSDGGYIVAGCTGSFSARLRDFWVLKLNSNGTISWQKAYGGAGHDYAESIQQTADGGYIVAGSMDYFTAGGPDLWVVKLTSDGAVSWQKRYGSVVNWDLAHSITQTNDGGYIVAGETRSFGAVGGDFWVLKLDSDGAIAWQKRYGGVWCDCASSIQQTKDGGYIAAGVIGYDLWILKLNDDGRISWQKAYGGTGCNCANSIQQTNDGGYIVAGQIDSDDFWVLKLNRDGTVAWQKAYGGAYNDMAYSIQQTTDGRYIVTGQALSFGAGGSDFWVLKLNSDGTIAFNPTSGAQMTDTNAVPVDTNCTVTDTTATAVDTDATVTDTNAVPVDTNATVQHQAP